MLKNEADAGPGACWSSIAILIRRIRLLDLLRPVLRGYSQILFCGSILAGALLFMGFIDSPVDGILSFACALISTISARLFRSSTFLVKSGVYAWNGALTSLSLCAFLPLSVKLLTLVLAGGILSAYLTSIIIKYLHLKYNLPVITIPFVLTAWALLALSHILEPLGDIYLASPYWLQDGLISTAISPWLPDWACTAMQITSALFFQSSIFIGLIALIVAVLYSPVAACLGFLGSALGLGLYLSITPSPEYLNQLIIGFNCALVGLALGAHYLKFNLQSLIYTVIACSITAFVGTLWIYISYLINMPVLAGPFNLVALSSLLIIRSFPTTTARLNLEIMPFELIEKPEVKLSAKHLKNTLTGRRAKLTLPFYGFWFVSNGNFSQPTHIGVAAYAWDFIVVNEFGHSFRGAGNNNEDFFCFGLPVIAPADGRVVNATDHIVDNYPPNVDMKSSWGNYIIIDHGFEEFSEISHLLQFSLKVKVGDTVKRGQWLGLCGNSGFSYAPHIHFQLQRAGITNGQSVHAVFSDYMLSKGNRITTVSEGIPKRGDLISSIPVTV